MKPVTEPQAGETVETRTLRRVVPASEAQSNQTPDLWEYLRALAQRNDPNEWAKHMTYVYRVEPAPSITLLKSANQFLTMPNGQQVPLADQEELEFALNQNFGGGTFRIIVKKGPQWATQTRFSLGGPVRVLTIPIDTGQPTAGGSSPMMPGLGDNATAAVAGRAFDALSFQDRQSAQIGFEAMKTAADVMQRFANGGGNGGGDDITRQFLGVMIQRMLQPPPDPLDLLTKVLALQAQLNPARTQDETTAAIMKAALDRLLNPAPSGGSPVNTGTALVQMLPALGNQFVEGIREFAKVRESEARIIAMQRGTPMPPGVNPQVLPPVAPNGAQPQPPPNGAPSVEFVDRKMLEILKAPNLSAELAADEAIGFLENLDASAVAQLASLGEAGLLELFSKRPILREATNNMPRLVEFIRAFLRIHAQDVAAEGAAQPGAPPAKPPLPN